MQTCRQVSLTRRGGLSRNKFTRPGRRGDRAGSETSCQKIVMIRIIWRVLEQKVGRERPGRVNLFSTEARHGG